MPRKWTAEEEKFRWTGKEPYADPHYYDACIPLAQSSLRGIVGIDLSGTGVEKGKGSDPECWRREGKGRALTGVARREHERISRAQWLGANVAGPDAPSEAVA